jgi:hypothetical protein
MFRRGLLENSNTLYSGETRHCYANGPENDADDNNSSQRTVMFHLQNDRVFLGANVADLAEILDSADEAAIAPVHSLGRSHSRL